MRTITFKGLLLAVVFTLLGNLAVHAADDGLITKQITIKLDKAGTLPDKIGSSKKYKITNLKIIGEINGTDWRFIREMAGSGDYDHETNGKLSILDLSEAKIVEGGEAYYHSSNGYTHNDVLGEWAFSGCKVLISLTIPSSVTSIGYSAFYGCSSLTSLTIPSSVTSIADMVFEGCSSLTSLIIPSGVTSIGYSAFYGCSSLTSLTIPSDVTSIGKNAFRDCSSLTSLTIPSGVTSIADGVFEGCSSLTSLIIPSGVTSIGDEAFRNCSSLTSFMLSSSVAEIGFRSFYECSSLKYIHYQINEDIETYLAKGHPFINVRCGIEYYLNDKKITSVAIPATITKLGEYAFQECGDLTSVNVSWQSPISAGTAFSGVDINKCTLYVPQGTEQDYWLADVWGDFGNIVEYDPTGIDKVTTSSDAKEVSRYSVNGQRLSTPTKGLNIVKYSDGSVKKIAVQ